MAETRGYISTGDDKGSINISQGVVATIAAAAAVDVEGVYGLFHSPGKELLDISGKNGISKGVKITIEEDGIIADVSLICNVGFSVSEVGVRVQKAVIAAIEEAIGTKVRRVNIHISGISMKKAADVRGPVSTRKGKKTVVKASAIAAAEDK